MINSEYKNSIVALSTATGGALCVVRLSGEGSAAIVARYFGGDLSDRVASFGIFRGVDGEPLDEVVCTYFHSPRSFTGEDMVEISCHGSVYIASEIVRLCVIGGARVATAGEFSKRAFLNGKMDLSQAEAVADLIASSSRVSARVAMGQMRGGYSVELSELRFRLLNIKSLLELELDFGDEDVEFASRDDLRGLLVELGGRCKVLADSFAVGNVLKHGVPVAIVGLPNVGKSTLLNALVGEQRSIVSSVAGTTRDYIEEVVTIGGVDFRFVDTAGLRLTDDEVESIGVERSLERMHRARIVLQLVDNEDFERIEVADSQSLVVVFNKVDLLPSSTPSGSSKPSISYPARVDAPLFTNSVPSTPSPARVDAPLFEDSAPSTPSPAGVDASLLTPHLLSGVDIAISAKEGLGVEELCALLLDLSGVSEVSSSVDVVLSNERHWELLTLVVAAASDALLSVDRGDSGDLVSFWITAALEYLGEITGEFTTDEVLANIFSRFCIGK